MSAGEREARVRWAAYPWRVVGGASLLLAGTLVAAGLRRQRKGRRRAEAAVAESRRFEHLLAEVSAELTLVPLRGERESIGGVLGRLGEFLGVERAALYEHVPGRTIARISWAVEGIERLPRLLEPGQIPWTIGQIEGGVRIRFARLDELPAEAAIDRQYYRGTGTRSCLALPLKNAGAVVGALSVESVRDERTWPEELVERLRLLGAFFASMLERKRAKLSLAEQLRFEALLAGQWAAFSAVSAGNVDRKIERSLGQIVDFFEVDRGSLAEFSPEGGTARITHEWVTRGAPRAPSALALGGLPWVVARLRAGELVRFSRRQDLPEPGATVDRQTYARLGITSQVEVPLMVEGQVLGALAFTCLRAERVWQDEVVQRLRLLGEVFAGILSRRRSEMEAFRLRQDLAHIGRVSTIGELTASLAHELSQPLTAILSNAEAAQRILESDATNLAEVRAILGDIVEDNNRATAMIGRLRGLLRKGGLELAVLDLNEVVGEVARLVSGDAMTRDVSIHLELAPKLPPLQGDRVQLQQVLLNLILNALDAMRESRAGDRTLVLRTARDGPGTLRVAVRDSGVGIAQADLDRIFDAFYTTKPDGLGMGLKIVRSIVQAHGGRLQVENNPAGGATFSFTLPVGTKGP